MKKVGLLLFTVFIVQFSFGQNGNFRSITTGNWGTATTWERDADSNGSYEESPSTLSPSSTDGTIIIQNTHNVTATANVTVDETTINSGGTLTVGSGATLTVADGTGDDLTNSGTISIFTGGIFPPSPAGFMNVNGQLVHSGSSFAGTLVSRLNFLSGSTYEHAVTSSQSLPLATWNVSSTCLISGNNGSAVPGNLNQTFGNFTWDTPSGLSSAIDFAGNLTDVDGNLSILNTNGQFVSITSSATTTLNIDGDFVIGTGSTSFLTSTATCNINVLGNFSYSGTTHFMNNIGTINLDVDGDFTISSGSFDYTFDTGNVDINIGGDIDFSGGTLAKTGTGSVQIDVDGGTTQNFVSPLNSTLDVDYIITATTLSLGTNQFRTGGDFTVSGSATLNTGTGYIETSSGTLTVVSTATLGVGSTLASGAMQAGTTVGNIRVGGSRNYTANATIVYNGSAAQTLGAAFPSNVNLVVNNASGVSLTEGTTISVGNTLTLTSGDLSIGANSLILNGEISGVGGGLVGGSESNLTIGGTDAFGTLTFAGTTTLNNFVINRTSSGSVTLGSDLTIPSTGSFTQTAGDVDLNGNALTLSGVISRADGVIIGNSTSSLIINGSGTITGTLDMSGFLETFTFDRVGETFTTGASMAITNLNLNAGTFANGAGISITSGGTITRQHNGSMNTAPSATSYNVVYNIGNPITTGVELLTSATALQNLTKQGGATLTVDQATTVNGILTLSSGTFDPLSNALTLEGNLVSNAASDFNSNLVTFAGTTTISGLTVPSFNDLTVSGSSSLTTPSGSMTVSGTTTNSGTFNASSTTLNLDGTFTNSSVFTAPSGILNLGGAFTNNGTFTNNGGTVVIDGTTQSISGSSLTAFNDLTLSNSGTATINGTGSSVAGTLTMSASSTLNANGKITLLSTGTSSANTARVAAIPGSATVSGNFIYQRFISGAQQFHNIGLPVTGGTTADIIASTYPDPDASLNGDFIRYNEATTGDIDQGWESSKTFAFSAISGTQGYTFWTRTADDNKTLTVTGPLNTGNVSLSVSYTDDAGQPLDQDGWNLVNNPYASQVDWGSGSWTKTNIDGSAYVWNPGAGTYTTLNGVGIIASGQSFWVHANAASPVLTATQPVKTSSGATFQRPAAVINDLTITLTDATRSDLTRIRFLDNAIEEFDSQHDGYKLQNEIYNLSSLTESGKDLSLNTLSMNSCGRTTKLNITNITEGSYELSFADVSSFGGLELTLNDKFLNESILLSDGYAYSFDITADAASYGDTRFEVVFSGAVIETNLTTSAINNCDDDFVSVSIDNSQNGLVYRLNNGAEEVASSIGNDGQIEIQIEKTLLVEGMNTFDMTINNEICGTTTDADNQITINYQTIKEVNSVTGGSNCGSGSVVLSAEGADSNGFYNWYESIDAAEPIANENLSSFTTPDLEASTTYYVTVVNSDGCESITRVPVEAVIESIDEVTSVEGGSNCGTGSIAISAEGANSDGYYNWYEAIDATEPISGENAASFTTPELQASKTYYVSIVNSQGCESTMRIPVDVIINELPETPEINAEGTLLVSSSDVNNQWYKDGEIIVGATGSTYEVTESGSYTVSVENSSGCTATSQSIELTITATIINELGDDTIRISPNPVGNEDLTISINEFSVYHTVLLYNSQGKLVMSKEIASKGEIHFDMGAYNKGIYFLHLAGEKGSAVYKILKN